MTAVAAGKCHTIAVTESHRVFAFGSNSEGQLGLGEEGGEHFDSPMEVAGFHEDVVRLAAGSMHSMALTRSGRVWVWGSCKCRTPNFPCPRKQFQTSNYESKCYAFWYCDVFQKAGKNQGRQLHCTMVV